MRKPGAASAPLHTPDDVRALVGLVMRKRKEELAGVVGAMLEGRSLLAPPPDPGLRYAAERVAMEAERNLELGARAEEAGYRMEFYPTDYLPARWPDFSALVSAFDNAAVRVRDTFPARGFDLRRGSGAPPRRLPRPSGGQA